MFRPMLEYKARWLGGQAIAISPANTSRACPACGGVDADNRKTQAEFRCVRCGHADQADVNAARNILRAGLARLACEVSAVVNAPAAGTNSVLPNRVVLEESPPF